MICENIRSIKQVNKDKAAPDILAGLWGGGNWKSEGLQQQQTSTENIKCRIQKYINC